ncbi:MAG TPA: ornithine cyclodeaminase family protein [Pirellulales bacterium]|jgi:ornithine cyclodeaminase/alanine dehydrogenase-like protein (mu-crystallin family)
MSALYLTEADVTALIDMPGTIAVVEEAFRHLAVGEAENIPRVRTRARGIILHAMIASAGYLGYVGWKCYTTTRDAARFHVGLYDQTTGQMVALIEADQLGRLRTGATTGVALRAMAPAESHELGLFGVGRQAETQVAAAAAVLPLRRAFIYSRSEERRTLFAEKMQMQLGIEVIPVDRPQEAAEDLPIVITATTSSTPVFDGATLAEGTIVCAVGANALSRAEIDTTTVRRADAIVCDSVQACRGEAGDFTEALEKGIYDWRRAVDLAEVVVGRASGKPRTGGVAIFKSVGLAVEDVAMAARLLQLAKEQKRGVALPF